VSRETHPDAEPDPAAPSPGTGPGVPNGATDNAAAGDGITGDATAGPAPVLPEPVRQRVLAVAADALATMPAPLTPSSLRVAARFTPAKRARLAGPALAVALELEPAFRQAVGDQARAAAPEFAAAVEQGTRPAAADPIDLAVLAYLLRPPGWRAVLDQATAALHDSALAARTDVAAEQVQRLGEELSAARAAGRSEAERLRAEAAAARGEIDGVKRRLREQAERARRAEEAVTDAEAARESERATSSAALHAAEAELRRLRARVAEAEAAVEAARRSAREGRSADEARLWLLLETVAGGVSGLKRELALAPSEERPADAVAAELGQDAAAASAAAPRTVAGSDPAHLGRLLALPRVHLVVDGYNVTKTGYGDLPLETQRFRLLGGLGGLAARTGAEVTCVFDGAERLPIAPAAPRGVRLLFSRAGQTADELVRRLVRAEPAGRPVVVVSSDREVADGVRRSGAHPVHSEALLRLLDRA